MPILNHSLMVMVFNPGSAVIEEHLSDIVSWLLEKQHSTDADDSENVTGNQIKLMRSIIGMFIKVGLFNCY